MAGGYGRGSGVPLGERVRATAAPPPAPAPPPTPTAPAAETEPCPARHCWVSVPVDGSTPRPALLLEWRQVGHRWEGRVVYAARLRPGRWAAVEEWVPAELLTSD